ncbi:hypothetical protein B0H13DRAFT_2326924 [Mycena leptocephala]|nr:hypothetical protein B0H13DRAFT_2326924 [Mycena leptocephala]
MLCPQKQRSSPKKQKAQLKHGDPVPVTREEDIIYWIVDYAMFHAVAENYPCYIHYDASTRFHVHAHRQICQYQGLICQTDGEMIEREWTTRRPAANVEGMKPGKRSPLIDLDSPLLAKL